MDEPAESPSHEEVLAEQFYRWELRGRGWQGWETPVSLEPPFRPFFGHGVARRPVADDGRRPTLVSGLFSWFHRRLGGSRGSVAQGAAGIESTDETEPTAWHPPEEWVELRVSLPSDAEIGKAASEQFLLGLSSCRGVIGFELVGLADAIQVQFVCAGRDADAVERQLEAYFPHAVVSRHHDSLAGAWSELEGETVVAEFGLDREFMLPLARSDRFAPDPMVGLTGALAGVQSGEIALLQVLFQPVTHPWAESVLRSVVFCDGTPFFCGLRDFVGKAKEKAARPLYAVVLRAAARSPRVGRAWDLFAGLAGALNVFGDPDGNELIALENYPSHVDEHAADVPGRQSRRSGMVLNSDELASIVHLPTTSVRSARFRKSIRRSCRAPAHVLNHRLVLGFNDHGGLTQTVTLSADQRAKHLHAIGASGTGKSTFLLNLIAQDVRNGDGVAVFDPHGDLIDAVLDRIPPSRIEDVVLIDPADEEYPVGFNILSAHSALEKNLMASDLVAVFRRLSTSWGDQMTSVLGNAILAFLESTRGGTLLDLRRFLVEPPYRREFLGTVTDPEVVYYWAKEFPLLTGRPQGPVLTRLDTFLRPKPIRYMVAQKQSRLDFANIMDRGKIFLARLSHGVIGEENSYLLGSLLVSKFHQLALGRQQQKESERRHFWMYVDEFHQFATPSMTSILSGARKYRLGLTLAHQELTQLEAKAPLVASAVIANAYTRVCFRVGDADAKKLESGFSHFSADDLQNLGVGEAVVRVERGEQDFNLRTVPLGAVEAASAEVVRAQAVAHSRAAYAVERSVVVVSLRQALAERDGKEAGDELDTLVPAAPAPRSPAAGSPLIPAENSSRPLPNPEPADLPAGEEEPTPRSKRVANRPAGETLPGRGGPEHKYLQQLIKQWGDGMGFRSSIEKPILDGEGSVDVALEKPGRAIACLISITTGEKWELASVRKCLRGAYDPVVVICPDPPHLARLEKSIRAALDEAERPRVKYLQPDELFAYVQELEIASLEREQTVRGYKVKTTFRAVESAEGEGRRDAVSQVVAKALTRVRERKKRT